MTTINPRTTIDPSDTGLTDDLARLLANDDFERVLNELSGKTDDLWAVDLQTLWDHQRRLRPPSASDRDDGRFGAPGWLSCANVAPALVAAVERLPSLAGDTTSFGFLTRGASRLLLERLPTAVLDCDEPCSPTSRVILEAAVRHRELRPAGCIVGPDREDERVMVDTFALAVATHEHLGPLAVKLLLDHDWADAVVVDGEVYRSVSYDDDFDDDEFDDAFSDDEFDSDFGDSDFNDDAISDHDFDDDEILDIARQVQRDRIVAAVNTTRALMPLWPLVAAEYGITGARHQPDEITLVRDHLHSGATALRFWWRWGTRDHGCPSDGGTRISIPDWDEVIRTLP